MKPRRYTPAQVVKALERTHGMVTLAAEHLRCTAETIYNYAKRYPTVAAELQRQRERTTDVAETKLYEAIEKSESWAVQFYLRTQAKSRGYIERHEVTGADGEPLRIHLSWDDARTDQTTENPGDPTAAAPSRPALRAAQ